MNMKKFIAAAAVFAMMAGAAFAAKGEISVLSREAGSGTRGAFIELMGIEQKNAQGKKVDMTTDNADVTNSTSVMLTSVSRNPNAIGYVSMGSLKDNSVKVLDIDGVKASVENIVKGDYKVARPFVVATKGELKTAAKAFLDFINSKNGQDVIVKNGYISVRPDATPYPAKTVAGKVVVAGSSSVTPVMEKLKEAYQAINSAAEIEVQQSDSTTGVNSAISGICDLGMASRNLKPSEVEKGLTANVIAMDGIAVIVNNKNDISNISSKAVCDIYTGKIENWEDIK